MKKRVQSKTKNVNKTRMHKKIISYCIIIFMILFSYGSEFDQTKQNDSDTESNHISLNERDVLILNGFHYGIPVAEIYTKSIRDTLVLSGVPAINIYVEYLDLIRKNNEIHRSFMQKKLTEKSINHSIDLIIAIDQVAADFIIQEGKDLFEGVPLIVSYDLEPVWKGAPRKLIIAAASNDAEGTVRYAFELFPNTQNVVVVMGKDDENAPFLEGLLAAIEATDRQVTIEKTNELSYFEMLDHIAALPPDTIAFYGSYFQDITGESFVPAAVANTVGNVANAPVFAFVDMHIMSGLLGGSVVINEKLGQLVAHTVVDYFSGALMLTYEPLKLYPTFYALFDYQQLRKWDVDPGMLPNETIFLNYTPSLWESHRQLIIYTGLIFIALIALTAILIIQKRDLKSTLGKLYESEAALRESRDRLAHIINATEVGTWELNYQSDKLEINARWAEIVGYTLEELTPCTLDTWRQLVFPEDLENAEIQIQQVLNGEREFYDTQFRMRHKKGTLVWILSRGKILAKDVEGNSLMMCGTHSDITEIKQLEEKIIESKIMYQSVVDTQQEMIIRFLPDTTLTFVNDAYCRALGKQRSELLGYKYLAFLPPEYHEKRMTLLRGLHSGQPYCKTEFEVRLSENTTHWHEWTDIALFNESGEIIEIQGVGRDITRSKIAEESMRQAYDATIKGWAQALDLKDEETESHSQRGADLTVRIAEKMGISGEELTNVYRGALLHDIGKMGIPDSILQKPGKLTDDEWKIMRKHPAYAYEMLSPIAYLNLALDIPYCHHEKWDGSGYPRGLKGEQIPLTARIFAVVDVYDALTSNRPYRNAWTIEKSLEHIKDQTGKHFDPEVVDMFLEEMSR